MESRRHGELRIVVSYSYQEGRQVEQTSESVGHEREFLREQVGVRLLSLGCRGQRELTTRGSEREVADFALCQRVYTDSFSVSITHAMQPASCTTKAVRTVHCPY